MTKNFIDIERAKEFAEKEYYPCIEGYVETKVIKDFLDSCPRSDEYDEWCPVCGAQIDGEVENG